MSEAAKCHEKEEGIPLANERQQDMNPEDVANDVDRWLKGDLSDAEMARVVEQDQEAARDAAHRARADECARLIADFDGRADEPCSVPSVDEFKGRDFIRAVGLDLFVEHLLRKCPARFWHLRDERIDILWKRAGGRSRGELRCGDVQKAPAILAAYQDAPTAWIIWIAADHARDGRWTRRDVDAVLCHQLCHLRADSATGEIKLGGHDFEGFVIELLARKTPGIDVQGFATLRALPLFRESGA